MGEIDIDVDVDLDSYIPCPKLGLLLKGDMDRAPLWGR